MYMSFAIMSQEYAAAASQRNVILMLHICSAGRKGFHNSRSPAIHEQLLQQAIADVKDWNAHLREAARKRVR